MIKRRLLANITIVSLIVLGLAILFFRGLPILLKEQLVQAIQQETGRTTTIANVRLTLSPLSLQIQDFAMQEKNGKPFANFAHLAIQLAAWQSIQQSALIVEHINLDKPIIRIIKKKDGNYNVSDLLKESSDTKTTLFPITLVDLALTQGQLIWQDDRQKANIQPIKLNLNNLSTINKQPCQFNLQANLESSGQLKWQGKANLMPLTSTGTIEINQLKLQQILAFIDAKAPFDLTGSERLSSNYQLNYDKQQFNLTTDKTKINLQDFNYNDKTSVNVKVEHTSHETNLNISYKKNTWQISTAKASLNLNNGYLTIDNTQIKLPKFELNTDVNINFAPDNWIFSFKKANLAINQPQITNNELSITSKNLSHTSQYELSFAKQTWQLNTDNSKLASENLAINYQNIDIKAKKLALETNTQSLFTDNNDFYSKQGKISCQDCQLFEKNQTRPLIEIPNLVLQDIDFNLNKQQLNIKSIFAEQGYFRSWLNTEGEMNYQTLFSPNHPKPTKSIPVIKETSTAPWLVNIEQLILKQFTGSFADQSQKPAVAMSFNPIDLKLMHYNNKTATKLPIQLNTVINKNGSLQLQGDIVIEPFSTQLAIQAKTIDLVPFRSYAEKFIRLDLIDGQLNAEGKLNANHDFFKFSGNVSIHDFITRDQKYHRDFITWKKLLLDDLVIDSKSNSYTAKKLMIDKPYSKVTIRKDKSTNFSNLLIAETAQNDKKPSKKDKPYFKIDKLQIINGSSDFTDRSIILPFFAQIKNLTGGANDISSDENKNIKVSLKGDAFDFSPVDIEGVVNPYTENYDLTLNFISLPMPLISPYMVEFAGYKVEKGKLSLKLKYKIANKQLDASNNILIDQFELGEKVENPKAVSLPLELAVALLKDTDGKITIDVPITGNLNDPQFKLSAIIADALLNALHKVISSPFHALADLLNGEEEELSMISFKAGKAELEKSEQQKLLALAKVLRERATLVLDIKGTAFETEDWAAIKDAALYDELKALRADELNQQEHDKKIIAEYIELSNADYKRLLAEQFIKKFPHLAKKSLFGKPELINATGDFYEVAKQKLSDAVKLQPTRLKRLATQRSQVIASFLTQQGHVPNGQIFILDSAINPERDNKEINSLLFLKGH